MPASRSDSASVSPSLSATCASSALPACETRPVSVRRDLYRDLASITHHLQGEPPKLGIRTSNTPRIPEPTGHIRAPASRGRGRYCTPRARLAEFLDVPTGAAHLASIFRAP